METEEEEISVGCFQVSTQHLWESSAITKKIPTRAGIRAEIRTYGLRNKF
jgi:hypothetical protein